MQDQLRDLITEIRGEENTTGCVEYDRFEKVIIRVFTDDAVAYKRDTDEKILRAFRAFDPEVRHPHLRRPPPHPQSCDLQGAQPTRWCSRRLTLDSNALRRIEYHAALCVELARIFHPSPSRAPQSCHAAQCGGALALPAAPASSAGRRGEGDAGGDTSVVCAHAQRSMGLRRCMGRAPTEQGIHRR